MRHYRYCSATGAAELENDIMSRATIITPADRLNRAYDRAKRLLAAMQRLNVDLGHIGVPGLDTHPAKQVLKEVKIKLTT